MTSRIDRIQVELDVNDEFGGRRIVKFDVSTDDTEFMEAVRLRWQAYYDELIKKVKVTSMNDFPIG